jgi:putative Mg2+ transporter-C (MgtC) family protein
MDPVLETIVKLLLAILAGGLIGAEREFRDKAAGFRTIIFICVGATLFTMLSLKLGGDEDPVRIAASIVSGVGFLGAGAILRGSGHVVGLTTAATIWLAAALGMGIGGGHFLIAILATAMILVVLVIFPKVEAWIDNIRDARRYEVVCPIAPDTFEKLEGMFIDGGLQVYSRQRTKSGEEMICTWHLYGSPEAHDRVIEALFAHAEVKEFKV